MRAGQGDAPRFPLVESKSFEFDNFNFDAFEQKVNAIGPPKEKLGNEWANQPNLLRFQWYLRAFKTWRTSRMFRYAALGRKACHPMQG
jgi:hypothetical protein